MTTEDLELVQLALASNNPDTIRLAGAFLHHPSRYKNDPIGFCRDILGVQLWSKQAEIAQSLITHKRVLVKSANAIGKSFIVACLAIWFYATHTPGICLLTAPTYRQVKDISFKEIRKLYKGGGLYDKMTRIESSPDHYVHGFTTNNQEGYQGIHGENLFVIFEECVGVDTQFWEAASSILIGGQNTYWLAVCNPTDQSSQAYLEEQSGRWHTISVSAWDHPNIALELQGQPPLIPAAIRLAEIDEALVKWATPVTDTPLATDIQHRGTWWRPGPVAEARLLGRYPSQGSYSIFSEADFEAAIKARLEIHLIADQVHIGCDVARFGDDMTSIHVRRGPVSIHHEDYNKRDTTHTAGRLKQLADQHGGEKAKKIPIKVDDTGVGGGVTDQKGDYNFIGINASTTALSADYPNKRSEELFHLADLMKTGQLSLAQLPPATIAELKRQALGITYKLDSKGRRVAEKKEDIKKRIGRSPDDLDAMGLAYYPIGDTITEFRAPNIPARPKRINF